MYVNCSHGKGIKFIREELKCFAKTNIQFNNKIMFKIIVLLNADNLTVDAQSALRRCIELFSSNTRFFIIVENKNRLLNPILSRFCEIYIPEHRDIHNHVINLHQLKINLTFINNFNNHIHNIHIHNNHNHIHNNHNHNNHIHNNHNNQEINNHNNHNNQEINNHNNHNNQDYNHNQDYIKNTVNYYMLTIFNKQEIIKQEINNQEINNQEINNQDKISDEYLIKLIDNLYNMGISSVDIITWIEESENIWTEYKQASILLIFSKNKHEFRCEQMAMFYLLKLTRS